MIRALTLTVAALLVADTAAAQSLKIRQLQRDETVAFEERLARLETDCGKAIPGAIDWSSFGEDAYRDGYSIAGYCESAVTAIAWMCADDLARAAINERIDRLECSFGDERAATVGDDGTYAYSFTWEDANSFEWHQTFLGNNL